MSDFKAQFKAAKASRGTGASTKLSKEQLKALKAQRAAAEAKAAENAAKQAAKQEAARAAAAAAPAVAAPAAAAAQPASSGPRAAPPKFAPTAPPKFAPAGGPSAVKTDTQVTQMHSGSSSAGPATLQSTASKGALPALSGGDAAAQHSAPPDLPSSIFEAPEQAASSETPSALPAGFFEAPENGAQENPSVADIDGATEREEPSSLPAGFFEAPTEVPEEAAAPSGRLLQPTTRPSQPKEQPGIIPKGFFADKDADAKARGEDTKKKSKEEEFSDFMSSIAVDVLEAEERDQEAAAAAAAERAEREQFEQRMRLQRLEELKTGSSEAQKAAAAYTLSDASLDVDVILDDATQQRKRRKVDLKQIMEPAAAEQDGEESSEEDLELDWRAKTV